MINRPKAALLFVNDFADAGGEKYYLTSGDAVEAVSADQVIKCESHLVCHDLWLIAPALLKKTQKLPQLITDVEELRISTSGNREDRENREKIDVSFSLRDYIELDIINQYRNIQFNQSEFKEAVFAQVGSALIKLFEDTEVKAKQSQEWERYVTLEAPVSKYLIKSAARGIKLDCTTLQKHKADIDFAYYMALKEFSAKHNFPLEIPSDEDVMEYLEPKGYDFSGVGLEYVIDYIPMADGFSDDLRELKKIATSRAVLSSIPLSQTRIHPIVDNFGSITSRIYYKDPPLQNLAKRHRNIVTPDSGRRLSYVDFGQFEAGIMAALSGDAKMLSLFASADLYSTASMHIFGCPSKRKFAKKLFLSYAYGMKKKNLIQAAVEFGADRTSAKIFFNQFDRYEKWKTEIWAEFENTGRIGTACGNFLARRIDTPLSDKEKRSAVSQVVQGTASLIFKKALLQLSFMEEVELKIPMHDAVLFQHSDGFDPNTVAELFANVVTQHFDKKITGKASVADFFQR